MDLASIKRAYSRYAKLYDKFFGAAMNPGRKLAVKAINGHADGRVLEVGVGTGLSLPYYRRDVRVTGIDVSEEMLAIARSRVAEFGLENVEALLNMDAEDLGFEDASFDVVVAMYVASVVPDPDRLLSEMRRVCVPGGDIIIVNHFTSRAGMLRAVEKGLSGLSKQLGWRPEFDLEPLLHSAGLEVVNIRKADPIGLFTLIHCRNNAAPTQTALAAAAAARHGALIRGPVYVQQDAGN